MPTDEVTAVETWLYSTLSAGTALCALIGGTANPRIYTNPPQGAVTPYVTIGMQAGVDENGMKGGRWLTSPLMLIKAVTQETGYALAGSISAEADALLMVAGTASSGSVSIRQIVGESPVQYPEVQNGVRYAHQGRMYRVHTYKP